MKDLALAFVRNPYDGDKRGAEEEEEPTVRQEEEQPFLSAHKRQRSISPLSVDSLFSDGRDDQSPIACKGLATMALEDALEALDETDVSFDYVIHPFTTRTACLEAAIALDGYPAPSVFPVRTAAVEAALAFEGTEVSFG